MPTCMLFMIFFTTGVAFVAFAQVYLYRTCHHVMRQSSLHWCTQQVLLGLVSLFLAFMYLPYLWRVFDK